MNNNRGNNNNRRRGRGNNNRQGGGGGQQLNRIDSRARGNAPQLLEKYRKLAHDAHLNGDRVTEEYYLQFADHYFRVLADSRVRQEEQRARRDDRWQEGGEGYREDGDDAGEYGAEGEGQPYGEAPSYQRREREERPRQDREARQEREPRPEREARSEREDRPRREREDRAPRAERQQEAPAAENADTAEPEQAEVRSEYEPAENPFTRDNRSRGLKPRREDRRPRRAAAEGADAPAGLDPSSLPPSISAGRDAPAEEAVPAGDVAAAEEAPKPKRRTRKPKAPSGDEGESLEAVG